MNDEMQAPTCDFREFYPYDELRARMEALANWKPDLAQIQPIGRSPEGREILMLTITRPGTGRPDDKPGYLVHGNLHAVELSGSACALHLAYDLVSRADSDPSTRELLDHVAFHICPRVSVDGAEEVLLRGHRVRSRETPEPRKNSITPQDIDGDGRVLKMRVPDPNGPWFSPDDEPRLLVPRLPGDRDGRRYRLTDEGLIHDWDGGPWYDPASTGHDFNRNWPAHWRPRHEQWGSGRYPFCEPEVRALADYVLDRPNMFGMMGLHTGAAAVLRPPTVGGDADVNASDIFTFRTLAALGSRILGFPAKAVHEYRHELAHPIALYGTFLEWGYRHCGLLVFEIELGNLYSSVGYSTEETFRLTPEEERERERRCLAWHDAHPEEGIFAEWRPFDHPQLGRVEIGGWLPAAHGNIVRAERLKTWERAGCFIRTLAARAPRLTIPVACAERLADGIYRVRCRVANEGHLPTSVTSLGAGLTHVSGAVLEVERPAEVEFLANRNRIELGHLGPSEYRELTWVVRSQRAADLRIVAHAPRAGRVEAAIALGRETAASSRTT